MKGYSVLRLSDVFIQMGFCSSRKEFKRQVKTGSVRYKDMVMEEDMVFLPTGTLTIALPLGDNYYAIPPVSHTLSDTEWLIVYQDVNGVCNG
jgi:hypothetical protein